MSGRLMGAVLAHTFPDVPADRDAGRRRGVSGATLKLIALGIANRANDDGRDGWPSFRELAAAAQCHTDTAGIALKALQTLGYVLIVQRGDARRSTRYALIPAALERPNEADLSARLSRAQRAAQSRDQRAAQPRAARGSEPRGTSLQTNTSDYARGQSPPPMPRHITEEAQAAAVVGLAEARTAKAAAAAAEAAATAEALAELEAEREPTRAEVAAYAASAIAAHDAEAAEWARAAIEAGAGD